jgi:hypothetical protein
MRMLPTLVMASCVAAATHGSAQGVRTLWTHNGSELYLSAVGQQREFRYRTPKPELVEAGVQPGTLLFKGTRIGNQYSGRAYVFPRPCGALPYSVAGEIAADERSVTMYGSAPSAIYSDCSVAAHRDDVLVFELASEPESEAQQGTDAQQYGENGRLFSSGADEYFLLSKMLEQHEDAVGYTGQVRVVHNYRGGGYEMIMKDYTARCEAADSTFSVTWSNTGDQGVPLVVRIGRPDRKPKSSQRESYNLYWAVCRDKFVRFK